MPQTRPARIQNKELRLALRAGLKLLAMLMVALCIIAGVNLTVDPSALYRFTRETSLDLEISALMQQGYNVEGISNFNERLVRRDYLNHMTAPVDILVAGSSRGEFITSEMLGTNSMFNVSVTGGVLVDIIGSYGILHQRGLLPERLIIVFDPWYFNDNYIEERAQEAVGDGYYYYLTQQMGYKADPANLEIGPWYTLEGPDRISVFDLSRKAQTNIFSLTYFQASIQRLFNPNWSRPSVQATTRYEGGATGLIRADGSYSYPESVRAISNEEVDSQAQIQIGQIMGLEDFDTLEGENYHLFWDFVKSVKADGVDVQILLEPLAPPVYQSMMANYDHYRNAFLTETRLYEMGAQLGIEVYGSFDPMEFLFGIDSFYDGYHLRPESLAIVAAPLAKNNKE